MTSYFCQGSVFQTDPLHVVLTPDDLQRWEIDFDQLTALIRQAVGLTAKATALVPERIWLLGRKQAGPVYWELFLMNGLCWPDGVRLLSQCSRLQQSPAPVVVVPSRIPPFENGVPPWPIRTLSEIVTFADSSLVIDEAVIAAAAGIIRTALPSTKPEKAYVEVSRNSRRRAGRKPIFG